MAYQLLDVIAAGVTVSGMTVSGVAVTGSSGPFQAEAARAGEGCLSDQPAG